MQKVNDFSAAAIAEIDNLLGLDPSDPASLSAKSEQKRLTTVAEVEEATETATEEAAEESGDEVINASNGAVVVNISTAATAAPWYEYGFCRLQNGDSRPVIVRHLNGVSEVMPDDGYRHKLPQGASLRARHLAGVDAKSLGYDAAKVVIARFPAGTVISPSTLRAQYGQQEEPATATPETPSAAPAATPSAKTEPSEPVKAEEPESAASAKPGNGVIRVKGQEEARRVISAAIRIRQNIMLEGHTGVGKTTLLYEMAHDAGKKLIRVNLNGQTGKEDFVGQHLVRATEHGPETYFVYGVLAEAMRTGEWLVCDEINAALPEILFVLQSALDDDRAIKLVENGGEVITAHPDFRFFATMNPSDEYAGTKELNGALKSRFGLWVLIEYPDGATEQEILVDRTGLDAAQAAIMVQLAQTLRKAKESGLCYMTISTRDLLRWAELTRELKNRGEAFKYTILNRAQTDAPFFLQTARNVDKEFAALVKKLGGKKALSPDEFMLNRIEQGLSQVKTAQAEADRIVAEARAEYLRRTASLEEQMAQREKQLRATLLKSMNEMMAAQIESQLDQLSGKPNGSGDSNPDPEPDPTPGGNGSSPNDSSASTNASSKPLEPAGSSPHASATTSSSAKTAPCLDSSGTPGTYSCDSDGNEMMVYPGWTAEYVLGGTVSESQWFITLASDGRRVKVAADPELYFRVMRDDGKLVERYTSGLVIVWDANEHTKATLASPEDDWLEQTLTVSEILDENPAMRNWTNDLAAMAGTQRAHYLSQLGTLLASPSQPVLSASK
jgi:MoxR-like ATPase